MKILNKILSAILISLSIIIIFIFIIIAYSKFIAKKDYPNIFGYTYMQVKTESMYPILKTEDIIVIKISSNFKEGDIVTYKERNSFITHRIVSKGSDYVITKGDSNDTDDGKIESIRVVGIVASIISNKVYRIIRYLCISIIIFMILDIFIRKEHSK